MALTESAGTESAWIELDLPDIEVGRVITVVAGGRALCVTRTADGWGVLDNRCPHQGGPLGEGSIEKGMLRCPWHCWEFDIRTGQSWCDPNDIKARTYAVTVEPGESLAKGPFAAETVGVQIEQNYVVLTL